MDVAESNFVKKIVKMKLWGWIIGLVVICSQQAEAVNVTDALKVRISRNNQTDETVIRFHPSCSGNYDQGYDALKLFSQASVPFVYTNSNSNTALSINALPSLTQDFHVLLQTKVNAAGIYSLNFDELGQFSPQTAIILEDVITGERFNVRSGNAYSFQVVNKDSFNLNTGRFMLHFYLMAFAEVTDADCGSPLSGAIRVSKPGTANWTVSIFDSSDSLISILDQDLDSVNGLKSGSYAIIFQADSVTALSTPVVIGITGAPDANFKATADVYVDEDVFIINSSSSNFTNYWNFGDGTFSTDVHPAHTYPAAGTYTILLTVFNGGCADTASKSVNVSNQIATSALQGPDIQPDIHIQGRELVLKNISPNDRSFALYSQEGKLVYSIPLFESTEDIQVISIPTVIASGVYIYAVNNSTVTGKILIQ